MDCLLQCKCRLRFGLDRRQKTDMQLIRVPAALLALACCLTTACRIGQQIRIPSDLSQIDRVVTTEIEKGSFPGAVILVGQGERILYWKSFGCEVVEPYSEPMTRNTIFDLASLTKVIATATSIMILADRNDLRLTDYVGDYLPGFACAGKEEVEIRHLLTHTSGLPAYTSAAKLKDRYGSPCPEKLIDEVCAMQAQAEPGEQFCYSCLGYIVLAKIVEVVSGTSIDDFSRKNIFTPLGMKYSTYNPAGSWGENIAATEITENRLLRGTVHDPLARLMGGVAGNAGLFSNAYDLSIYCRMILSHGVRKGVRFLSSEAVNVMTTIQSHGRAYGFDVASDYAWVKGSCAPAEAFCHTGYTGTSIVCEPVGKLYVIVLTNRVHPCDEGNTRQVRTEVADIVFQHCQ